MMSSRENINGILLLDKPLGITSNSALQKAKYLLRATKAGHTGSLDPMASGMLPLCFGEATKFSRFILEANKCYQTTMQLGVTTTTGDSEGEVVSILPVKEISALNIQEMLKKFKGAQTQIPSMYSALKYQGQPLYKFARKGVTIERAQRPIVIHDLVLDSIQEQEEGVFITLTVVCSKGTYIRTLVEDMGTYLGCGAHVVRLHRLWVSPFTQGEMVTLEKLNEAKQANETQVVLISMQDVMSIMLPCVHLSSSAASYLRHGRAVQVTSEQSSGWVTLVTVEGEFLGVGEMLPDGWVAPRRLLACAAPLSGCVISPSL